MSRDYFLVLASSWMPKCVRDLDLNAIQVELALITRDEQLAKPLLDDRSI